MTTLVVPYRQMYDTSFLPMLWVRLAGQEDFLALVDSGATINVLPYSIGLNLGLNWADALTGPEIGGSVAGFSKKVKLLLKIRDFDPLELEFCWLNHDRVRLILGHWDFLQHFDVCFSSYNRVMSLTQSKAARASTGGS